MPANARRSSARSQGGGFIELLVRRETGTWKFEDGATLMTLSCRLKLEDDGFSRGKGQLAPINHERVMHAMAKFTEPHVVLGRFAKTLKQNTLCGSQ